MVAILIILAVALIEGSIQFCQPLLDDMVSTVFKIEDCLSNYEWKTTISFMKTTFYQIGVGLIVLKFLKKAFDIYVLWSDGDPDTDPFSLLVNFGKAMVTAISFPYLYGLIVRIGTEVYNNITVAIDGTSKLSERLQEQPWKMLDPIPTILSAIFFICLIVLAFQFIKRGLELLMMQLSAPLACCGLLDNDKGVFKQFFNQIIKAILTTLFQITFCRMGIEMIANLQFDTIFTDGVMGYILPIGCIITAIGTPRIMSEFLIPTGGSGVTQKIYSAGMAANMFRKAMK